MMTVDRRRVLKGLGATAGFAAPAIGRVARAAASPRVVIIGGGAGGATAASYLRRNAPSINVTLIEPKQKFTTPFFSNWYLGGLRTLNEITHTYQGLKAQGVNVLHSVAVDVDPVRKSVTLINGSKLAYDRLILSPGIDISYGPVEGYTPAALQVMPHAWQAGDQVKVLRAQLEAMPDGGLVVLTSPPEPYRCPVGPYERACMIAHYLKANKPRSKLLLLDAKRKFVAQQVFTEAFRTYYAGIIELNLTTQSDDFALAKVDPSTRTVTTKGGQKFNAAVANIIPPQRAGSIAQRAGCVDGDWCPVKPQTFASTIVADIHVIGDSAIASDMPKSGFSANSQAKLVARVIAHELAGNELFPQRLRNSCWAAVATGDAIKLGANYAIRDRDGREFLAPFDSFSSEPGEDAAERKENFDEAVGWYAGMTADMFAKT